MFGETIEQVRLAAWVLSGTLLGVILLWIWTGWDMARDRQELEEIRARCKCGEAPRDEHKAENADAQLLG